MEPRSSLSSTRIAGRALVEAARLLPVSMRRGWFLLVPLYLADFGANQFFSFATDYLRQTGREDLIFIAMIACLELVFSMIWSAGWILVVAKITLDPLEGTPLKRTFRDAAADFHQIVIEQIRSLASTLWRAPFLIVPGLVRYVRLSFVPLVVITDPNYVRGRVDALKRSDALSRHRFLLLAVLVLATLFLPSVVEQVLESGSSEWVWRDPLPVLSAGLINYFIELFTTLVLIRVFALVVRGTAQIDPPPAAALGA